MSKFLQSRVSEFDPEEYGISLPLTVTQLRSLVPGNFYLLDIQPDESSSMGRCILMLHEKGLFVFSHCEQDGILYGDTVEETWTSFNYLGDSTTFPSPYRESQRNISILSELLKLPKGEFCACLLFGNQCELRKVPNNSDCLQLIYTDEVEAHFAKLLPTLPVLYSPTQLSALRDIFLLVTAADNP